MEFIVATLTKAGRSPDAVASRTRSFVTTSLTAPDEAVTCDLEAGRVHVLSVDGAKPYTDQTVRRVGDRIEAVRGYTTITTTTITTTSTTSTGGWSPARSLGDLSTGTVESPGGIYSAMVADVVAGRLCAWTSQGTVEGVFWAENDDAWLVGTSALAVHCLAQSDHRVRFDVDWGRHVIVPGSTLHDDTPYQGVRYVRARTRMVFDGVTRSEGPHPVVVPVGPVGDSVDRLVDECVRAVSPARRWPDARLSLSGGKDSRAALAALLGAGIELPAFTMGTLGQGEVAAARAVAAAAGVGHSVEQQPVTRPDQFWWTVFGNLAASDGLLSENRHLVFGARPGRRVEVHGQAHHLRGGYMVKGRYPDDDAVRSAACARFTGAAGFCVPEIGDEVRSDIDAYLEGLETPTRGLKLYWMYNDVRMARWLQAAMHHRRRSGLMIWPFLDERVLVVAAGLAVRDRVSESAQYELIARHAPTVAPLGLYDSRWRFDSRPGSIDVHLQWQQTRSRPFVDRPGPTGLGMDRTQPAPPLGAHLRTAVGEFAAGQLVADWLSPAWKPVLDGGRLDRLDDVAGPFALRSFAWRVIAVSAVLSGEWLPAPLTVAG